MAELIKRKNAIDVLKETGIIQDNDLGHLVVEEIERIPTTTEAEIRAKAIDEFVEKFAYKIHCESCSSCTNCYETGTKDNCGTYRYYAKIAEQLKGE